MPAIRWAFRQLHVQLRIHAHIEMVEEGLSLEDVLNAGAEADLLEDYPERNEGHTLLLLGHTADQVPIHIVVNIAAFNSDPQYPIHLVTVYEPRSPGWQDERTRGRIGGIHE